MSEKDWRQKAFSAKFKSAAVELDATSASQVESLKFRDLVGFRNLPELLDAAGVLHTEQVDGDYQGRAWKLTHADGNRVIVVEHETGLEVLYIVGALAGIINLVLLIADRWIGRGGLWPHHRGPPPATGPEIRRLDARGSLIEEAVASVEAVLLRHALAELEAVGHRIHALEGRVSSLSQLVGELEQRAGDSQQRE